MIKVLIADDHAIVREGLRQLFALCPDLGVAGEAVNGGQVLSHLRGGEVDLLLLDMAMSGISGVDLIKRVRLHHGALPVLVLSMHNEVQIARRALAAGANGYLTKDCGAETLTTAIRKVASGGRYIDPRIVERMVFEGDDEQAPPHEQLSSREQRILGLLGQGRTVNEIAAELSISNKTVSTHKARLMQKMSFANNAELMRYVFTHDVMG
ncbi:response regulator [Duganella sp. FT92W]|uniref:Response regulator n=1 Tax=Pseudoduganella rivuli TaxID=2666085 RepID=A0A7X2LTD7_9BURK|nr:response regulator transcription factor [Pseudoduganella rivuli]MRV74445.1 response regulator [Pseudoduganella rivuli]